MTPNAPGVADDKVAAWLIRLLPDLEPPLEFSPLTGGRSNLSIKFVDRSGAAYVLRRPPLGNVLESAHDMVREYRIVSALGPSTVPVAPTHGVCEDISVTGAPFYIMTYVDGLVLSGPGSPSRLPREQRAGVSRHLVEVLAALHDVDIDAVGLGDLARREGYIARQLKRWTGQWQATKTHEVPEMDELVRLLNEHMPEQVGTSIVHGDYRLGNMIVAGGQIQAVLDWELCTLGDPLADLGYLLNNWPEPGEPNGAEGYWTRNELCEAYATASGRDLGQINFYQAFSSWRMAAINQGVYKRYLEGSMADSIDLEEKKQSVQRRAEIALNQLVG